MTAKNTSRRLALLAAVLSVLMLLSFAVIPGYAEEATTEEVTAAVTEAETTPATEAGTKAETEAGTAVESGTSSETSKETTSGTSAGTTTGTGANNEKNAADTKRLVINLGVGGFILLVVIILLVVFRKKIPGFTKALKSECGKIVWCPKDKLKKNAIVVLVTIVALALAIFLMDLAFSRGIFLLRDLVK